MRPGPVVMLSVRGEDAHQVAPAEDEDMVQALSSSSAYPSFREGVRLRREDGCLCHCQAFRREDLVEGEGHTNLRSG